MKEYSDIIFKTPTNKIIVKAGLNRIRDEMGNIKSLKESITKYGQFVPILINRDYELLAGGRRLLACTDLGIDVKCAFRDTISDLEIREIELEEIFSGRILLPQNMQKQLKKFIS